jgi:hypothetical protein
MELLTYTNFDLLIRQRDGSADYPTHVLSSLAGQSRGLLSFSSLAPEVVANLTGFWAAGLGEAPDAARTEQAQRFGELLFDALVSGEIRSCFDVSLNMAKQQQQQGLRVRLRIEPPELAGVPWELMRDRRSGHSLSRSSYSPIVRYVELQQALLPLTTEFPLNVMVVLSSPTDQPPLDVEFELNQVMQALDPLIQQGAVQVSVMKEPTLPSVHRRLLDESFNVLHFMGHAHFSADDGEGYLVFEDRERASHLVSGRTLGELLRDEHTLRLVTLNACSTAATTATDVFSGVATSLVRAGIPAVVAMQAVITDQAAQQFSTMLYQCLADGSPIEAAVTAGRNAIAYSSQQTMEWAIPQLYTRTEDGVLFNFRSRTPGRALHGLASDPEVNLSPPSSFAHTRPETAAAIVPEAVPSKPPLRQAYPVASRGEGETSTTGASATEAKQLVLAGPFICGTGGLRDLPGFWIDTFPVTNEQYLRFVRETGAAPPSTWVNGRFPNEKVDHPVTGVSWHDAAAYASWGGQRLPTAAEWEKAARGTDGRRYPWGDEFDPRRCNTAERGLGGTTPVGQHPSGASPYGVMDMAGNTWEWTADEVRPRGLGREDKKRALKGGAWDTPARLGECAVQSSAWPDARLPDVGFRCARSA